jgi:hypothetical protein
VWRRGASGDRCPTANSGNHDPRRDDFGNGNHGGIRRNPSHVCGGNAGGDTGQRGRHAHARRFPRR